MTYDVKCAELAASFLSDYSMAKDRRERLTRYLAEAIQSTITDFLHDEGLE